MNRSVFVSLALAAAACTRQSPAPATLDLSQYQLIDLTHAFNAQTIYWPTSTERFALKQDAFGQTPGGLLLFVQLVLDA